MHQNSKVVDFLQFKSDKGLEALDRLTGLTWDRMPKSLVNRYSEVNETVKKSGAVSAEGAMSLAENDSITAVSEATVSGATISKTSISRAGAGK
ncbi:hypothetical protein [Hahella ganghwensis]|uniref:hypothetical protein n=1 Tax=Hahella ganghwensis TaxID=286420 RepID=UPI00035F8320|nr:hypothetical protein [Hahella ganghwensis]